MLTKFAFGGAVDFQDPERRSIALQNDVHGPANAVLDQEFWCSETLLIFEVV